MPKRATVLLILLLPAVVLAHVSVEPTYEDSGFLFWASSAVIALMFIWGRISGMVHRKKGTILSFESSLKEKCSTSNLPVKVELDTGKRVTAEVAGCTLCYHRFKVGSRVALDIGPNGRLVVQQPAKMSLKERFDLSMESCAAGCLRDRESKQDSSSERVQ